MPKKWLAGILLIMLAGYMGWNLYQTYSKEEVGIEEGQQAPDFSLRTLSGEKSSLQDTKGKKVLLNFWATWCKPCRQEMPAMEQLQKEHADELAVVAVNFTTAEKSEKQVRTFADTYDLTFPILIDNKGVNADYNVMSYPTTYILNEKGVIQDIHIGTMTKKEMEQKLDLD
ncbi:redoxin domain-containing protein [Bacillus spizizenii]|uniref:redoxin domain-containing protein n=1 Tax=Bacillus spizizenii TaxID=96241 RepID=UPI0002D2EEDA|nr:redoxin domain-containing protein [Bacillus spizizenii]